MGQRNVTVDPIGVEDLSLGTGSFTRNTSTGGTQAITQLGVLHNVRCLSDFDTLSLAIADLPAAGGTIMIPEGTFDVSDVSNLILTKPLTMVGVGRESTILNGGQTSGAFSGVFLDVRAALTLRGIQFNNCPSVAYYSNNTTVVGALVIEDCGFNNCGSGAYWNTAIDGSGITDVIIQRNVVSSCDRGFFLAAKAIASADVSHNVITTVVRKAIKLGFTNSVDQPVNNLRVVGNYINGVADPVGISGVFDCNAIDTQGNYGVIANNVIHNVTSGSKDNSEGIYTKLRGGVIANNTMVDAGENQGAINIKGGGRNDPGSLTGRGIVCVGNNIRVINNTGAQGINIASDDVVVANNLIEGVDGRAIRVLSDATNTYENILIAGNICRDCVGSGVIAIQTNGNGITVENNVIDTADGSATATTPASAISVTTMDSPGAGITRLRIRNNTIRGFTAAVGRAIWIIKESTQTMSDVVIKGNDIDGAPDAGIALSGDDPVLNIRITDNRISNITPASRDIVRTGTADYSSAGAIVEGNHGDFVNNNRGQATLASGTTSIAVTHGLSSVSGIGGVPLPEDIIVHPIETLGSASYWWVDTITATQFTINTNADPAADVDFAWQVNRRLWQQ